MAWSEAEDKKIRSGVAPKGTRFLNRSEVSVDSPHILRAATLVRIEGLVHPRNFDFLHEQLGILMLTGELQEIRTVAEIDDPTPPSTSEAVRMIKSASDTFVPVVTDNSIRDYLLSQGHGLRSANARSRRLGWNLTQHVYGKHVWNREEGTNYRGKACVDCMCPLSTVWGVSYPYQRASDQRAHPCGIDPRSLIGLNLLGDERILELMAAEDGRPSEIFGPKSLELVRELGAVLEHDLSQAKD